MERLIGIHGAPEHIRGDNGSEFIHRELQEWLRWAGIKTLYIDPGSPWQNESIESFHSNFRRACLDREQLGTPCEARVVIEDWRLEYNAVRPHKSLRLGTPLAFAGAAAAWLRSAEGAILQGLTLTSKTHIAGGPVRVARPRAKPH